MISAYLDGEAGDPAAVEALLERDPEARRLRDELERTRRLLQGLPAPDVSPAFAARVMAHVADPAPARAWWKPFAGVAGPALAAVLLVAALAWAVWPPATVGAPGPVAGVPGEPGVDGTDEAEVLGELFVQVAAGGAVGPDWIGAFSPAGEVDPQTAELIEQLAPALDATADLDTLVATLNPEEAQVFRQLLLEYAGQEVSS